MGKRGTPVDYVEIMAKHREELEKRKPEFRPRSFFLYISAIQALEQLAEGRVVERKFRPVADSDYAVNAPLVVIMAAITLEAGANEIIEWFSRHPTRPVAFPDRFDELSIETKWFLIPLIAKLEPFKKGERPWQDFSNLVTLRNAMVHPKPGRSLNATIAWLEARRALLTDRLKSDQFGGILSRRTAYWSIETVEMMFHALNKRVGSKWRRSRKYPWPWEELVYRYLTRP